MTIVPYPPEPAPTWELTVSFLELVGAFTASTGVDAVVITVAKLEVGMGMREVEVVVAVVVTCSAGGVFARAGVES
jgi:hypothetical protein